MSKSFAPPALVLLAAALVGCRGYSGSHPSGTGPFDSRGNYVEAWADNPSKWNNKPSEPEPEPTPQPTTPPPVVAQNNPAPQPAVTQVAPKPTPTVVPKPKPKPKPKPQVTYHTVRKGDTLYGLAKKYGTTVGKIQSANGISGSVIRIGQRLKIPR